MRDGEQMVNQQMFHLSKSTYQNRLARAVVHKKTILGLVFFLSGLKKAAGSHIKKVFNPCRKFSRIFH